MEIVHARGIRFERSAVAAKAASRVTAKDAEVEGID
jgi:hypothetical protein